MKNRQTKTEPSMNTDMTYKDRHTSNENVLKMMDTERQLLKTIERRITEYFRHIIRGPKYHLLHVIIQGRTTTRRSR